MSKWYSIFRTLHLISILTTFGWRKVVETFVKWRNFLNREGRGKRNLAFNCSLLKTMSLEGSYSVDTRSPPNKWIEIPSGTWKPSLNSRALSYLMDFCTSTRPTSSLSWTLFLPLPATLVETSPLRDAILK